MRRGPSIPVALAAVGLMIHGPISSGDTYFGIGGGIKHSKDSSAYHIATTIYRQIEAHFSDWNGDDQTQAVGIGYRFGRNGRPSAVLGYAYVRDITENLLRHSNAYMEIRIPLSGRYSCQIGHYSTIGDDTGENFVLCGAHIDLTPLSMD
jgi:hypothetical protein